MDTASVIAGLILVGASWFAMHVMRTSARR